MSAVAIIPAKGTSRRIPHKNIREFMGKPMICYPIAAAHQSGLFEHIVVSTDDVEIASLAKAQHCSVVVRPSELCEDTVGTQEVAAWTLRQLKPSEYACVIYPCVPMMTADDLFVAAGMLTLDPNPAPFVYVPGWFYWGTTRAFLAGTSLDHAAKLTIVEPRWIDIDTPEDWAKAEVMYAALHPEVA